MKATKAKQVTYLGQRALVWEVQEEGPTGRRSVYVKWIDDAKGQPEEFPAGTTTKQVITGRRPKTTTLVPLHVVTGADAMTPPAKAFTI